MKNLIAINEGSAKIINDIFKDWNGIKNATNHNYWQKLVKLQRFGTYQQLNILEALEAYKIDKKIPLNYHFLKELKQALK